VSPLKDLQIPSEVISELDIPQLIDIRAELPVNPKYTWAQLAGVRDLNALTTIVLHHDALPKYKYTEYSDLKFAQIIATNHINSKANEPNGDPGFPYDIWIRSGKAYWTSDILPLKYGVRGNNGYTVHVCVSGDYHNFDALTDPDRNCLIGVVLMLKRLMPAYQAIKGHKELVSTLCPGYDIQSIRESVTATEMRLERNKTRAARRERAFAVVNQAQYMYSHVGKEDGNEEWALNYLGDVYEIMKSKGLL